MKKMRWLSLMMVCVLLICQLPAALAAQCQGKINDKDVAFRITPDTDGYYWCRLKKGTRVTVTGTSGSFYKVEYDGNDGYVMKKFVSLSGEDKKDIEKESSSKYASARHISELGDAPDYSRKGSRGDHVEKLQQALKIRKYYDGNVDGIFGDQTREAVTKYQKAVGISQTGKADYDTIKKLFGKVAYTTAENDPKMKGITRISQLDVPCTCRKGNSGKNVIILQQALKLKGYYKAPIDGSYGEKTKTAVMRFQKSRGLSQDGVAGNDTIKALFGKNAADYIYKTEKLNWFDGGKNIIPKGAEFTIKDVATGYTFRARRWSGYNHMDTEPLTAEDTRTMKKIYGGEWSWDRRAILVKYNGHVYAASMNGMPHGTTTISDNQFDGHFCVHFYKSKTHGSKRVDGSHQRAVNRAMNASW